MVQQAEGALSPERPWPGMRPYREEDEGYFFGRSAAIAELLASTERAPLTVLYARSGLGKTSLLRAGLGPRLPEHGYLLVYLRPRALLAGGSDPVAAVIRTIQAAVKENDVEATSDFDVPSLWELFHRDSFGLWDSANRVVTPVLAFDQFEEVFQLVDEQVDSTSRVRTLLENIAELVENRLPAPLAADLPADAAHRFDMASKDFRVILSFREDYLPLVRRLRTILPSVIENHVRLEPLSGEEALEVVERAGRDLIADEAAVSLVQSVGRRSGMAELLGPGSNSAGGSLSRLEVEPAVLSVVCFSLNEERQQRGQPRIDLRLVRHANAEEIFDKYYQAEMKSVAIDVRSFVEDDLVKGGVRVPYPVKALEQKRTGFASDIDELVDHGVLRKEWLAGADHVELSHDLLVKPVERAAQEAAGRRRKWWAAGMAIMALLALGLSWLYVTEQQKEHRREYERQLLVRERLNTQRELLVAHAPDALPEDLRKRFEQPPEGLKALQEASLEFARSPPSDWVATLTQHAPNASTMLWLLQLGAENYLAKRETKSAQFLGDVIRWIQLTLDQTTIPEGERLVSELKTQTAQLCKQGWLVFEAAPVQWFQDRGGVPAPCEK